MYIRIRKIQTFAAKLELLCVELGVGFNRAISFYYYNTTVHVKAIEFDIETINKKIKVYYLQYVLFAQNLPQYLR